MVGPPPKDIRAAFRYKVCKGGFEPATKRHKRCVSVQGVQQEWLDRHQKTYALRFSTSCSKVVLNPPPKDMRAVCLSKEDICGQIKKHWRPDKKTCFGFATTTVLWVYLFTCFAEATTQLLCFINKGSLRLFDACCTGRGVAVRRMCRLEQGSNPRSCRYFLFCQWLIFYRTASACVQDMQSEDSNPRP